MYVLTFFSKSLHFFLALFELNMDDFLRLFRSNRLARVLTEGRSRNTTAEGSAVLVLAVLVLLATVEEVEVEEEREEVREELLKE